MWFIFQGAVAICAYVLLDSALDPTHDYGYAPGFVAMTAAFAATFALSKAIDWWKSVAVSKRLGLKRHKPANGVSGLFASRIESGNSDKLINAVGSRKNLRKLPDVPPVA